MADANIFQQYLQPVRSVQDFSNDLDKQEQNGLSLAASRLTNQTAQQGFADDQAYRQAVKDSGGDTNKLVRALNSMGLAKKAQEIQQFGLTNAKTQAETALANAHAGNFGAQTDKTNFDTRIAKSDQAIKDISAFSHPDEARANLQAHIQAGDIDPVKGQAMLASIPQDPAQFPAWQLNMLRGIMSAKDQMALQVPDANTVANNNTSIKTTGMNNATSVQTNAATQAGENSRAAAGRATQLQVAGVAPGGTLDENTERTAQAIAKGQLPAPTGMALLNPKNQRILGRVMEINPQYDYTEVAAKKAAATSFGTGQLGNALRSVSTANAHLDQMNELVDALGNGNTQVINKVNNWYQTQTGNPAPTNFNAIKNVVGQEVVKAIVAGGGGVGEREEAAKAFSTANSPAQLKEAIQHYRMVMGAQADNLLAQRDAAGLSRSTLPNYNGAKAAADSGAPSQDAIAAEVARRAALAKKSPGAGMR